ncbi:hypothetical protein AB3S75_010478 [Citrus x aurantiifolia]
MMLTKNISSIKMILIVTLMVTAYWHLMEVEARNVVLKTQSSTGVGSSGTIGETFYQQEQKPCSKDNDCLYLRCIDKQTKCNQGHCVCSD